MGSRQSNDLNMKRLRAAAQICSPPPPCDRMSVSARQLRDFRQEAALTIDDLDVCFIEREPGGAIDFRKRSFATTSWRPLDLKAVGVELRDIEVGVEREGVHDLAAFLPDFTKRDEGGVCQA